MPLIRDVRRWFYPKPKFKPALRTIISPYTLRQSDEQERLLMAAHVARSPQDARHLMNHYGVKSAQEVIDRLPPRKRPSLRRRWILLMRRAEGHDTRDIYGMHDGDNKIHVRYRYKR